MVARELTKVHETFYRGSLAQLLQRAQNEENFARGEITVVVHGAAPAAEGAVDEAQLRHTVDVLLKELPPGRAAALAAQLTGAPRATAYALALKRGTAAEEPEPAP